MVVGRRERRRGSHGSRRQTQRCTWPESCRSSATTVVGVGTPFDTHEVTNQPPPLVDYDVFAADGALVAAVAREGGGHATEELGALGRLAGSSEAQEWGRQANANPPVLRTHDRYGHRLDVVDYHPDYHRLMTAALRHGLHAAPWAEGRPGAHVVRAAKVICWYQVDGGHICPVSMTYASVPALRHEADLAEVWEGKLTSPVYDPANRPGEDKAGITVGMAMTEKQGGSDVRANTTTAEPLDDGYRLVGHKWFCSAPMSDAFLMLAQAPGGLTCFWVPRWCPDGSRNPIRIQRLKDKLGDRSNASSEIELAGAWGTMVGDEGRGVPTIIEMVNHTRLDCVLGATAILRQGVAQATWHARHRATFGAVLDQHPLMANVLADLVLESEAATVAAVRLAGAFDRSAVDEEERLLARLLAPVLKYWTCKRAPAHAAEALECLGGVGYVEETDMPRLFRQSPLNGIWEGSGNVMCLDVLRALLRTPAALELYWQEVDRAGGADGRLDRAAAELRAALTDPDDAERRARHLVERMALVVQASLLVRHAPSVVADAFCASRLDGDAGLAFGTLPPGVDTAAIVERARPAL
ncbi:MAG: acyl-CoA dehydrogenase family protein [Acidimicrobiia bacterium]|nr:acyl-CoA dehydrogenase family protein [Acidimicrobiia bacterium]